MTLHDRVQEDADIRGLACFAARPTGEYAYQTRIDRLAFGNPGQHRVVAGGIDEMKSDCGRGYLVYYTRHGNAWVLLLCGGDKASQHTDIKTALALANALGN